MNMVSAQTARDVLKVLRDCVPEHKMSELTARLACVKGNKSFTDSMVLLCAELAKQNAAAREAGK